MINFVDSKNKGDGNEYSAILEERFIELKEFFGVEPAEDIEIEWIYSREKMRELWGDDAKISAMVDNKNPYKIYIYHPSVFEEYTDNKSNEIVPILIHEIAHTFVTEINHRCFSWMNEGVCEYAVGADLYDNKISKKDWDWFIDEGVLFNPVISWSELRLHSGYEISFNLVKYLVERFGKEKFFELLAIYRDDNRNDYSDMFGKIICCDFSDMIKDFEKKCSLISE